MVQSENTDAVTNNTATNQIAHFFFSKTLTAVIRLKMPIKPRCGAKLAKGNKTKRKTPEMT
jgi:hypothetical protein